MPKKMIHDKVTGERRCRCFKRCGGCQLDEPYADQIERKQQKADGMLSKFAPVKKIIPMAAPTTTAARCRQSMALTDISG